MDGLAPGMWVEMYRGKPYGVFQLGAQFLLIDVWNCDERAPCGSCLPGYLAPCIAVKGVVQAPEDLGPLCGCCFRPVRRGENGPLEVLAREEEPV